MPNPNYMAGARFERTRKKHYESLGNIVIRAAGSKGPFDLIVLPQEPYRGVLAIQCKRAATPAAAARLISKFKDTPSRDRPYVQMIEVYVTSTKEIEFGFI